MTTTESTPESTAQANAEVVQSPEQRIAIVLKENNLEGESAQSLQAAVVPLFAEVEKWRGQVASLNITSVAQVHEMKLARQTRLALKEIRVNGDKKRKAMKEASLRYGRAVDGAFNLLAFLITPLEEDLLAKEQFAERQEEARVAKVKLEREEILRPYGIDTSLYQLGLMPDQTFADMVAGLKAVAEQKVRAAAEAEQARAAAEAARLAEEQRVKEENARLLREKAEREDADRKAAAEAEAKRLADAEAARVAKEKADAEAKEAARARDQRRIDRLAALAPYEFDSTFTPLADLSIEDFAALLEKAKADFAALAKQRADAEAARIAQEAALAEERRKAAELLEAQRVEAERIAKEAADQVAAAKAASDAAAAKAVKELAERDAKARADQDAADAKAEKERKARLAAEAELKRTREAEAKRVADEAAAAKKAAAAPDKEKLEAFRQALASVVLPPMSTPDTEVLAVTIATSQKKFNDWLAEKISAL